MKQRKERNYINVSEIIEDYKPDDSIFTKEEFNLRKIKHIIFDELTEAERNTFLFYSECGSQRKTAEALGISLALCNTYIKNIKQKILLKL